MLFSITNLRPPATDLGYLLHKNPARIHTKELPFGLAHVFYPEAADDRCTATLLLDVDPIGLVRGRIGGSGDGLLDQYVNDRPYAATSLLSVALRRQFAQTLAGKCKDKPDLVETELPLVARIPVLPCNAGEAFIRSLFEPLGYAVSITGHALDPAFPEWGQSNYFTVELSGDTTVRALLTHLYVLIPVLDDEKHYYVGDDEVEKLLRNGEGWLAAHPQREAISNRYLRHRRRLTREALARLTVEEVVDPDADVAIHDAEEVALEAPVRLHDQRLEAVMAALVATGATSVADLGCGDGKLLAHLKSNRQFARITGMDVSMACLEKASKRLHLDEGNERLRARISLLQGSLTYCDDRLKGFDAAALVEVIEHIDPARLPAVEHAIFGHAQPGFVIVTTPNAEYNVLFPTLSSGTFRHRDHRFEWSRDEFQTWCSQVAGTYGYTVEVSGVGTADPTHGAPSQMAVFAK